MGVAQAVVRRRCDRRIFTSQGCVYFVESIHHIPEFWDKPEEFDPERFLPEKIKNRPRFAYFPFGAGSRVCIGQNLALLEAQLAIAAIAQRYEIDLLPGQDIEPDPTFTLIPKGIVTAAIKRRK